MHYLQPHLESLHLINGKCCKQNRLESLLVCACYPGIPICALSLLDPFWILFHPLPSGGGFQQCCFFLGSCFAEAIVSLGSSSAGSFLGEILISWILFSCLLSSSAISFGAPVVVFCSPDVSSCDLSFVDPFLQHFLIFHGSDSPFTLMLIWRNSSGLSEVSPLCGK